MVLIDVFCYLDDNKHSLYIKNAIQQPFKTCVMDSVGLFNAMNIEMYKDSLTYD